LAGETTALAVAARSTGRKLPNVGLTANPWTLAYSTTNNETNDVMEAGYLPEGVTLLGFIYAPDDLDSSTGLVHKITVGSTDVATGLTGGQTGAKSFVAITPLTTTEPTLVKITTTTAATTAVAGNVYLTPVYFSA
jgi:hypothetical protein